MWSTAPSTSPPRCPTGPCCRPCTLHASRLADLAIVQVDAGHPLTPVQWGDSTKLRVGDQVFAIGNPLGIGVSVSAGIVSGLNRNVEGSPYDDYIQTDAAINHGNSGGPLFDMDGHVVGVDTALVSPTAASAGLGLAIPADSARFVLGRLMQYRLGQSRLAGREGPTGDAGSRRGDGIEPGAGLSGVVGIPREPGAEGWPRDRRRDPALRRCHARRREGAAARHRQDAGGSVGAGGSAARRQAADRAGDDRVPGRANDGKPAMRR